MADAGELIVRIKADIADLEKGLDKATKSSETAMSSISKAIISGATAWKAFEVIGKGIEFNKAAEQAKIAFTVMTGSAEKATSTLKNLKDYANTTPLEFKDLRDATQTMLSFGISADKATTYIKQIGDISGGNADRLKSISLAFSQIASTGKLMGQDLLQLINAGFNPLQEISQKTGKSMGQLKAEMENGLISFEMVQGAFESATSEGGRFFGMLEKQGQTLGGKLSTMSDALDTALGAMTQAFEGPIKAGADAITAIANGFSALPAQVQAATGTIVAMGAALVGATAAAKMFGITLSSSFGPIALAATAAVAAIMGVVAAVETEENKKKQADADAKEREQREATTASNRIDRGEKLAQQRAKQERLEKEYANNTKVRYDDLDKLVKRGAMTEEEAMRRKIAIRKLDIEEIQKQAAQAGFYTNQQIADIQKLQADIARYEERIKQLSNTKKTAYADEATAIVNTQKIIDAVREKDLADSASAFKARTDLLIENINKKEELEKESNKKSLADLEESSKKAKDTVLTIVNAIGSITKSVFAGIAQQAQNSANKQIAELERIEKIRLINAGLVKNDTAAAAYATLQNYKDHGDSLDMQKRQADATKEKIRLVDELNALTKGVVTEEKKEQQKKLLSEIALQEKIMADKSRMIDQETVKKLEQDYELKLSYENLEKEKAKIKYKADKAAYDSALATAIVNASLAIITGFAQLGPVGGAAAAIATGVATGFEIDNIKANAPTPPAFARGTNYAPSGLALVGEQGPELVRMRGGEKVFTNSQTNAILGSGAIGKAVNVIVNNYSPRALDPAQSAQMTRQSMRQLSFQGAFA